MNPQPDNFTTCGRLGIEVNQYNNPIECYADETIEDMREEKVIVDHPELADKLVKANTQVCGSLPLIVHALLLLTNTFRDYTYKLLCCCRSTRSNR